MKRATNARAARRNSQDHTARERNGHFQDTHEITQLERGMTIAIALTGSYSSREGWPLSRVSKKAFFDFRKSSALLTMVIMRSYEVLASLPHVNIP